MPRAAFLAAACSAALALVSSAPLAADRSAVRVMRVGMCTAAARRPPGQREAAWRSPYVTPHPDPVVLRAPSFHPAQAAVSTALPLAPDAPAHAPPALCVGGVLAGRAPGDVLTYSMDLRLDTDEVRETGEEALRAPPLYREAPTRHCGTILPLCPNHLAGGTLH
jgi:hypothetical protein